MKIISIHVQAFGKLSDFNLTLADGVNVIQDVNGFGKTTLASFVRAMLYGFTYKKIDGAKDNERFAPWNGVGLFGGSMVVEHDGVTYRIERFFGSAPRNETLTVTNDKTGKPLALGGAQPGEYFLGLTADSYDRSAYFPQEAVALSSNDNFDARLANLIENGADDFDKIQEKLRAYKKNYRHEKGGGGLINELEREKYALLQKQRDEQRAELRAKEIEETLKKNEVEKQSLLQQREELNGKKQRLDRELARSEPSPEQLHARQRLAELNEKIARIPPEFDEDFKRCEEIANEIASVKEEKPTRKSNKIAMIASEISIFFGAFLAGLGATNFIPNAFLYVGILLAVVGAVGVFVELLFKRNVKGKTDTDVKKNELISQYLQLARKYVYVDGDDIETAKKRLWDARRDYSADLRARDALQDTVKITSADTSKLEDELKSLNQFLIYIEERLNAISMQVGRLTTEREGLTFDSVAIEDQLLAVAEKIDQAEFDYKVADTVSRLLAEAKDNLSSSYLPKLTKRCGELLSGITSGNYEVVIDRSFNVRIRQQGQTREMNCYSRGIREITLLCFRIALSELLYDGDVPFIIIDDAFVNFDEKNFLNATQLLNQLAKSAQVVYFTCHDRLGDLKN